MATSCPPVPLELKKFKHNCRNLNATGCPLNAHYPVLTYVKCFPFLHCFRRNNDVSLNISQKKIFVMHCLRCPLFFKNICPKTKMMFGCKVGSLSNVVLKVQYCTLSKWSDF